MGEKIYGDGLYEYYFDEMGNEERYIARGFSAIPQKPTVPVVREDSKIKRTIYASKKRVIKARKSEVDQFIQVSKKRLEAELAKMKKQSWNADQLSTGIYKIFDEKKNYRCTGTLVGGRMFVVNHVINESLNGNYTAANHQHSIVLPLEKFTVMNDEIGFFPIDGITSPFKTKHMKVLEEASIVSVFGFGAGEKSTPDVIQGFASTLGWCNAATRPGDCTSPVLTTDGYIVGLWTHGNGKTFGRFEPITTQWLEEMKENAFTAHDGMLFRSRPLSQNL
jgi:hypothetical protein